MVAGIRSDLKAGRAQVSGRSATRPLSRSPKLMPPDLRARRASRRATNRCANEPFRSRLALGLGLVFGQDFLLLGVAGATHAGRHGVDFDRRLGFGFVLVLLLARLARGAVAVIRRLPCLLRLELGLRLLDGAGLGVNLGDVEPFVRCCATFCVRATFRICEASRLSSRRSSRFSWALALARSSSSCTLDSSALKRWLSASVRASGLPNPRKPPPLPLSKAARRRSMSAR